MRISMGDHEDLVIDFINQRVTFSHIRELEVQNIAFPMEYLDDIIIILKMFKVMAHLGVMSSSFLRMKDKEVYGMAFGEREDLINLCVLYSKDEAFPSGRSEWVPKTQLVDYDLGVLKSLKALV